MSKTELQELLDAGVKVNPMQWVETDKNGFKRRHVKSVPADLKSRLVGCGNFEDTDGFRTDSPTGDVDAHSLVFSWCASHKVKIRSVDIKAHIFKESRTIGLSYTGSRKVEFLKNKSTKETFLRHEFPFMEPKMQEEVSG